MRILARARAPLRDNTFVQSLIIPKRCLTNFRFCFVFWMALSAANICKPS